MEVVPAGDPCADLPPEAAVHAHSEEDIPRLLVLVQSGGEVGVEGDSDAEEVRGPDGLFVVAQVAGREQGAGGDLLTVVAGVGHEVVVVDPDAIVRVAGREGDLEDGGEEGGVDGEVELDEGGVLEVEAGLGGAEDEPDDEDDEEDEGDQDEQESDEPAVNPAPLVLAEVVAAVPLIRHRQSNN